MFVEETTGFLDTLSGDLSSPVDCSNPREVNEYLNHINSLLVELTERKGAVEAKLALAQMTAINNVDPKSDSWIKVKNSSTLVISFANSTPEANDLLRLYARIVSLEKLAEKMSREIITLVSSFKNK